MTDSSVDTVSLLAMAVACAARRAIADIDDQLIEDLYGHRAVPPMYLGVPFKPNGTDHLRVRYRDAYDTKQLVVASESRDEFVNEYQAPDKPLRRRSIIARLINPKRAKQDLVAAVGYGMVIHDSNTAVGDARDIVHALGSAVAVDRLIAAIEQLPNAMRAHRDERLQALRDQIDDVHALSPEALDRIHTLAAEEALRQ